MTTQNYDTNSAIPTALLRLYVLQVVSLPPALLLAGVLVYMG